MRQFLPRLPTETSWRIKRLLNRRLNSKKYVLLRYTTGDRPRVLDLADRIGKEVEFLLDASEACQIFNAVRQTAKLAGDLAEVGVYQGGSAKLIAEAKGDRPLHLFDTFEGLPETRAGDAPRFRQGQYAAGIEQVRAYLKDTPISFSTKGAFQTLPAPCRIGGSPLSILTLIFIRARGNAWSSFIRG
jgi:hypothetical protein